MPNHIDVFDEHNQPTGQQASIDHVLKHGLWHRGAHIIVVTKTGYVLLQRRSKYMITHPHQLDISCGGYVDSGESPLRAAARELHEEFGLAVPDSNFIDLGTQRYNHHLPKIHRHDRLFVYRYLVVLPSHHHVSLRLQHTEVDWGGFLSYRETRRLLRRHRLKRVGKLEPRYAFYRDLLTEARAHMQ